MSSDEVTLLRAAVSQLDGKLDYGKFAKDIGAPNSNAAMQRWLRYKKKLFAGGNPPTARTATPSPRKTPNSKSSAAKKSPTKKRKAESSEDDADDEIDLGVQEDRERTPVIESPTRRLPSRKAGVSSFKEEQNDEDEEEQDYNVNAFDNGWPDVLSDADVDEV